jgi:hypothetical protein
MSVGPEKKNCLWHSTLYTFKSLSVKCERLAGSQERNWGDRKIAHYRPVALLLPALICFY